MGINSLTLKFKEELTMLINKSQLPPVNVMLVMESVQKEVNNALLAQLQCEKSEEIAEKGE